MTKKEWKETTQCELDNLKSLQTWELVPRSKGRQVVTCNGLVRKKYGGNGELERCKARLVTCGYSQLRGINFNETFSRVIK